MTNGKLIATIFGVLAALVGSVCLIIGGIGALTYGSQIHGRGYFSSPAYELASEGYALTSRQVEVAPDPADWWPAGIAEIRIITKSTDDAPVFVGIGPSDEVDRYLSGVAYAEITNLDANMTGVHYRTYPGGSPSSLPAAQDFWEVKTQGPGEQPLVWEVERGEWSVVVMNADGSTPVNVELEAGVKVPFLMPLLIGVVVTGLVLVIIAVVLLVYVRRKAVTTE